MIPNNSRRKFLKGVGVASTALVLGSPTVAASEKPRRAAPEAYQRRVDQQIRQSYRQQYAQTQKQVNQNDSGDVGTEAIADPRKSVWLGTDTCLCDAKAGDHGTTSSFSATWLYAEHDTTNDEMEALAFTSGGFGTATAWAWIGRTMVVEDSSGSQMASFTADGYMNGSMSVFNDGTNYVKIQLIVEDHTSGTRYDETIFEKGDYIKEISQNFTDSMYVDLKAGHEYTASIETLAEITVDGDIEEASSDFSREDDGDERVEYHGIYVDF